MTVDNNQSINKVHSLTASTVSNATSSNAKTNTTNNHVDTEKQSPEDYYADDYSHDGGSFYSKASTPRAFNDQEPEQDHIHTNTHEGSSTIGAALEKITSTQQAPFFPGHPPEAECTNPAPGSDEEKLFPEGGAKAWLCVFGSWCSMVATFGMVNCGGPIQAWLASHQLKHMSESQISWIFSIYAFLFFFGGVQVGPIFDAYGLKYILIPGCIGSVLSVFFLSLSDKYYQIILGYGVLGGLSASLIFTPAVACIGHFFFKKRGLATGIAATGGAFGGVIYPLAMNKMVFELSFGWTMRVIGFVNIGLLVVCILTLRTRVPPNKQQSGAVDFSAFKDARFTCTTLGCFMLEFGIFVPVNYLTSYSLHHGIDSDTSYRMVVFLSCGSILGRFLPGWFADLFGRFNVMITTVILCSASCLALWLPAGDNLGATIAFSVLFGVFSGSGISLTPVCISQICKTEDYGKRYGTCYFVASIGVLVGLPIAGAILQRQNGSYQGLIIFSGLCYFVGGMFFIAARIIGGGTKLRTIY